MTKKDEGKSASKGVGSSEKKKVGRPSSFMQDVADDICSLLAQGESLRKICERPGMPSISMVFRWLNERTEFRDQYARAREAQTESMLEDVLMIADSATPEDVQVAKLRVDARKWAMSKLAPKKYGDKVTQEISGIDGTPIQQEVKLDLSGLSVNELEQLEAIFDKPDTTGNTN